MDIYHISFVFVFILLFLSVYHLKGWKKILLLIPELLFAFVCGFDYAVTLFRGRGLVCTDIGRGSTLFFMLKRMSFPGGYKFGICLLWLSVSVLIAVCGKWTALHIFKRETLRRYFFPASTVCLAIGIGLITDYPTSWELFRGSVPQVYKGKEIEWYERDRTICHALGETSDGQTLTNSYNALEYNYARGFRTFETDIIFTADGQPVLRHEWGIDMEADILQLKAEGEFKIPSLDEFLESKLCGKYTTMSLLELFQFMDKREDMYIVFDTKLSADLSVEEQYRIIVELARENGLEHVLKRTVVQLYYYDMYESVESVYPFEHYLLTLYVVGEKPYEELGSFMTERNIPVLTVPYYFPLEEVAREMAEYGIKVYTHTIDDFNDVRRIIGQGVYGVYTDAIPPYILESNGMGVEKRGR